MTFIHQEVNYGEPAYPDPEDWPFDEVVSPDIDADLIRGEEYAETQRLAELALRAALGETINGSAPVGLFERVQIIEGAESYGFVVPPRNLEMPYHDIWQLEVSGWVQWFKQLSDFGDVRFTNKGDAGWIPHVFPFEDVDERGLPVILDRERASVNIKLTRLLVPQGSCQPEELWLETPYGAFTGHQSIEMWYCWGGDEGIIAFDEFLVQNKKLYAEKVVFDPNPKSLDFELEGKNDWSGQEHFGSIWVPMDLLRAGINPLITFPELINNKKRP